MKSTILLVFFIIYGYAIAQTNDSIIKSSWYGRIMPYSICTGGGSLNNNYSISPTVAQNVEIGVSYGVIDAGISYGSYSYSRDTTSFAELKITMDASQYGIYSNEFSVGFGRIFNSKTPIMLDASYTIMAQVYSNFGIGITTGYYDFVGTQYDISKIYYGFFMRYGLIRDMNGSLNRTKMRHRKR